MRTLVHEVRDLAGSNRNWVCILLQLVDVLLGEYAGQFWVSLQTRTNTLASLVVV